MLHLPRGVRLLGHRGAVPVSFFQGPKRKRDLAFTLHFCLHPGTEHPAIHEGPTVRIRKLVAKGNLAGVHLRSIQIDGEEQLVDDVGAIPLEAVSGAVLELDPGRQFAVFLETMPDVVPGTMITIEAYR